MSWSKFKFVAISSLKVVESRQFEVVITTPEHVENRRRVSRLQRVQRKKLCLIESSSSVHEI